MEETFPYLAAHNQCRVEGFLYGDCIFKWSLLNLRSVELLAKSSFVLKDGILIFRCQRRLSKRQNQVADSVVKNMQESGIVFLLSPHDHF